MAEMMQPDEWIRQGKYGQYNCQYKTSLGIWKLPDPTRAEPEVTKTRYQQPGHGRRGVSRYPYPMPARQLCPASLARRRRRSVWTGLETMALASSCSSRPHPRRRKHATSAATNHSWGPGRPTNQPGPLVAGATGGAKRQVVRYRAAPFLPLALFADKERGADADERV